jgi:hypothetical protein
MKTVLAPGAPWPTTEVKKPNRQREVGLKAVRINFEKASLDYFLQTKEELNRSKVASNARDRDKQSGRFKGNNG